MDRFVEGNQLKIAKHTDKYLLGGVWGQAAKSSKLEASWSSACLPCSPRGTLTWQMHSHHV